MTKSLGMASNWKTLNDLFARLNLWGDNVRVVEGITRADAEREYDAAVRWLEAGESASTATEGDNG